MTWLLVILAFLLAYALTAQLRKYALSSRLLDHPNARSSHKVPTPRGGGLSIVIATTAGVLFLWLTGVIDRPLALALTVGGLAIALVGFVDDRGSLPVSVRMIVHIAAAIWAMVMMGGLPAVQIGAQFVDLGTCGDILGILAITWALNLFNFMDGIDGIAASEAVFVNSAFAFIALGMGTFQSISLVALILGSASLGFLVWNWPPAKIFLGDVGSGYLGYALVVLAMAAARESPVALFVWLTLGGAFFVDATVTIVRRLTRRERVYQAHRGHAYQWLSRRWRSHLRVTQLVLYVNVLWLLPMAWLCIKFPSNAWWISIAALGPLAILAIVAGAGRAE